MTQNAAPNILAPLMATVDQTVENGSTALTKDFDTFIHVWKVQSGPSIENVLSTVSVELKTFLKTRSREVNDFVKAAKNSYSPENAQALFKADLTKDKFNFRINYLGNFLRRSYLQEAARDWHDMQRVAYQRDFYRGRGTALSTLQMADQLACDCLQKAVAAGMVDENLAEISPICYFDKTTEINKAPYTDLPLISVPLTATAVITDMYAVLHEMGHYVFHHPTAKMKACIQEEVDKLSSDESSENLNVRNWFEEVFADVFAWFIGGEAYNGQFRGYLLSGTDLSQVEFEHDDGEHPPILIRLPSAEWDGVLSQLGIEKNDAFQKAEKELLKLNSAINECIRCVSSSKSDISAAPTPWQVISPEKATAYSGGYTYKHKTLVDLYDETLPLKDQVDRFRQELLAWGKAPWPTFPRPWPGG